jgi:hypothetical protein
MPKTVIAKNEIDEIIMDAEDGGLGREVELPGENFQVDITVMADDVPTHPELVGGTVRVVLNKYHHYIGHTIFLPKGEVK